MAGNKAYSGSACPVGAWPVIARCFRNGDLNLDYLRPELRGVPGGMGANAFESMRFNSNSFRVIELSSKVGVLFVSGLRGRSRAQIVELPDCIVQHAAPWEHCQ